MGPAQNGRRRARRLPAWLFVLLAVSGCASEPQRSSISSSPASPSSGMPGPSTGGGLGQGADGAVRVNCDEAIGEGVPGSDPGTGSVGILGVVGLPASPQHMSLQTSASGESGPGMRLFAKQGLYAKATAQFEILVPAEYVGRAAVVWGNPGTPTTHLFFGPCGSIPTKTGWLSYAGGYLVADPMCLPLLVRSAGHEERVTIGVGRPCPGQRANPGHSDP